MTTLKTLVDLPKGWTLDTVQCVKDWAAAGPEPSFGEGVYLFHFVAGAGWRYYDQARGWDCRISA
ncbi:hypothetical protein NKG94_01295 [Micromonospora sp. M12]